MNSIVVVLIMATIVAIILIRTVRRDLSKYEQLLVESSTLDMKDEAGWKLVTGDVFRAPNNSKMLAVQVSVLFFAKLLLLVRVVTFHFRPRVLHRGAAAVAHTGDGVRT